MYLTFPTLIQYHISSKKNTFDFLELKPKLSQSNLHAYVLYPYYIGCGRLWVVDGQWKLMFAHCMMKRKVKKTTLINRLTLSTKPQNQMYFLSLTELCPRASAH